MKIYVNENDIGPMSHWTDILKQCQRKLHQYELDGLSTDSPIYLLRNESVEIPKKCEVFTLFDSHCFKDGLAFRNVHVALSAFEIMATPSVRSQLSKIITKSQHLFNDIEVETHVFKQLFLSCGILINMNDKFG